MVSTSAKSTADIHNKEHEETPNAKRVVQVDDSGGAISPSNPLPVTSVSHTSIDLEGKGAITVGTSAVELDFAGITESIIVTAAVDNIGLIYVGKSNVTSDGSNAITFLDVGESLVIDYNDSTNALYVVSDTASQEIFAGAAL